MQAQSPKVGEDKKFAAFWNSSRPTHTNFLEKNESRKETKMPNAAADAKKAEGNAAFVKKDYPTAIARYTEAIEIDPSNHVYFSNRSAAHLGAKDFEAARADGQMTIQLNETFVKGYHRLALALQGLNKYEEALDVLKRGQKQSFNNPDLNKLFNEIEPQAEKAKLAKRRGLSPGELLKEEGNDLFKKAAFDDAITKYTAALDATADKSTAVAIACYNNRAACYQQQSNYSAVIGDCTMVLEVDEKNQKALLRRGLAYEGLERYRLALQDIRALLAINPSIDVSTFCIFAI